MSNKIKFARHTNMSGKKCLVRVDFNVPFQEGRISDDTRIQRILPGLKRLMAEGARLVLLSHLGRPKGEVVPELSLAPIVTYLEEALGKKITLISDILSEEAPSQVEAMTEGDLCVAENIRFYKGEEANDAAFAKALARLGDVYIADAFSAAHRAHASTEAITTYLPSYAGDALADELMALEQALQAPKRPVVAVVGGAKVSTKLAVLENLIEKTDAIILGGGMANSFLGAQGVDMKASLSEPDLFETALRIMAKAKEANCQLILPTDGLAATTFKAHAEHAVKENAALVEGEMVLDVGPASIAAARDVIANAATILWNGPMGAFEIAPFDQATIAVAQAVAARTQAGELISVAGGGDTVAALNVAGVADKFTYLSLAGGAFLEWLEGKTLPGIAALSRSQS